MNTFPRARATAGALALATAAILAACSDATAPQCDLVGNLRQTDVPTFLNSGQPVATFHLQQVIGAGAPASCGGAVGDVQLVITSDAPVTQSFAYVIQGDDQFGQVAWSASGQINGLAAGAAVNEGTIITTPIPIDDGAQVILTTWRSP